MRKRSSILSLASRVPLVPLASLFIVGLGGVVALLAACAPRQRMCAAQSECGTRICVAGRCQPDAGVPEVQASRRLVFEPAEVAYLAPGLGVASDGAGAERKDGVAPPFAILGKSGEKLLLRFSIDVPAPLEVVEAYVLLAPVTAIDADPVPISLHGMRITSRWNARSTSWALAPALEDMRTPSTRVTPAGARPVIRVDVRELVRHWRAKDERDQGIAIVADESSPTGMAFALLGGSGGGSGSEPSSLQAPANELPASPPRLEVYVR